MAGCLLRFVLLPIVIIAAFYPLFSLRSPFPTLVLYKEGADVAAFFAGLFTWWLVISWLDMRQMASDIAMTRDWSLKDGERTVISGHIEAKDADAPLLTAPFSGEECVGYCYDVSHYTTGVGGKSGHWWTDYVGYALVPSIVQGPLRTVNILAEPDKELFYEAPARELKSDEDCARAEEYVNKTDFGEKPSGLVADTRTRLIHDGPGHFREDKAVGETRKNLGGHRLKETVIKKGETVLVSGVYSVEQSGIAPDPDSIMKPFHLVVGGDAALRRKMRNRVIGMAISAGLALVVFAVYFLVFVPRES